MNSALDGNAILSREMDMHRVQYQKMKLRE